MRASSIFSFLFILLVIGVLAAFGYGAYQIVKQQDSQSRNKAHRLQSQLEECLAESREMQDDYKSMKENYGKLNKSNEDLKAQVEKLTAENKKLRKDLRDAHTDYLELEKTILSTKHALQKCATEIGKPISDFVSSSENDHPVRLLKNRRAQQQELAPTPQPAEQQAPAKEPTSKTQPAPSTQTSVEQQAEEVSQVAAPIAKSEPKPVTKTAKSSTNYFSCPSPNHVNKKLNVGFWSEAKKLNWWVDFTNRPLYGGDEIKGLFQVLFDGNTVACYYQIGKKGSDKSYSETWAIIKASDKTKEALVLKKGDWSECTTNDCDAICKEDDKYDCEFTTLKTMSGN